MKISGFTFIRNGLKLGYPFLPSIRSLLPLCDEIVVNVPASEDETLAAVGSIGDPRIRIITSSWDDSQRTAGLILSHHTNLALDQCSGDWRVYIQGDEVLHEASVELMRGAMQREFNHPEVQGLLVDYTHFYGSFWTEVYSFGWYYKEVRVVRADPRIRSVGDAQGFRTSDGKKLRVKNSGGRYFHYGFALDQQRIRVKKESLETWYEHSNKRKKRVIPPPNFYHDDQKVKRFAGSHPAAMGDWVAAATWTYVSRNPLIRFRRDYFWEDVALIIRRLTGITLGVHKNYKLLK